MALAGLAVRLDDDLVIHARHCPGKRCGPGLEVDVAPPKAKVGTSAVARCGDERPRDPEPMLVSPRPREKRARLFGGPHRANGLGLGFAWGRGVPSNVVVHQAELDCIIERAADDRMDVANGSYCYSQRGSGLNSEQVRRRAGATHSLVARCQDGGYCPKQIQLGGGCMRCCRKRC